ncbi:PqqD family peptide modification chaperone [Brachybacterium muris]|uniref:PqqD family peptide modification chaperone n=1 Tax=Brachybacterium epidermidis TaxID=2781983 RepID=A0ABR9VZ05_9MICO|nr:PqqD family peptide modification chaperone [Brachybacterium sp. p3-SID1565]MBE9403418.1 PqqD family peptide modification chaperone [Brachybacterium epidermidis]MCT1385891.1 PqqD family peptide modification chaperone [Brachybacterium sp. p3-SID1565]MCT1996647.1 PqqD family peptide modification chaperone [Brachybacterium muris]
MTRYRLRPLVSDWDGEDLWVGALPHGPINRIQGVGALVLELLADAPGRTASPTELAARLRQEVEDVPEDAEQIITVFLAELDMGGILETIEGDAA